MWYYSKNGAQLGPIGPAEMQSKFNAGEISPNDLVWREGMADWLPAEKVAELQALIAPMAPDSPAVTAAEQAVSPYAASPYTRSAAPLPVTQLSQGLAIASMVCGIVSVLTCCAWCLGAPVALVGVILGHVALSKAKSDPARFGGKRMAKAGLITGYLGLVGSIAMFVFGIWMGTQTPDQIRQWNFMPEELREQFIRQLEMQQRMRESQK